ncbi:MAG: HAD-IIIA family hydrolase [Candidatus Omnitrophica bacterium]|nr:HAD-IIIA family hydrolase [Candidatus Omnitrophota bacterium]MDD5592410.1 HAD-IIIA family hydrolase [Candidatus Omnitrophota bacterium]
MDIKEELIEKAKRVRLLMLDVDGVLTDGRIIYDSHGRDMKFFDCHDGLGVYLLKKSGIPTILITAKGSRAIAPRARDMRVEAVFENISPKTKALDKILKKYKVDISEICFAGDDLVDLGLMKKVGFPIAVFNAAPEIKQAAAYITLKQGGRGAVREIAELILKAQGKWEEMVGLYDL